MTERISSKQFHQSEGVEDWRVIGDGACAYFRTGSFAASARLVQAISQRDYSMIMGTTVIYALLVAVANLSVDLVYVLIDPRIRLEK